LNESENSLKINSEFLGATDNGIYSLHKNKTENSWTACVGKYLNAIKSKRKANRYSRNRPWRPIAL
jgi:hypothetical protein